MLQRLAKILARPSGRSSKVLVQLTSLQSQPQLAPTSGATFTTVLFA
jgi:hypothetical protein